MSIRRLDSGFNLRKVVAKETASNPVVFKQSECTDVSSSNTSSSTGAGIRFDLPRAKSFTLSHGAPVTSQDTNYEGRRKSPASPLKCPFHTSELRQADIMHMTAKVESLTHRLNHAMERAAKSDERFELAQRMLLSERSSFAGKVKEVTAQLGAAHTTESRLRADLAKALDAASSVKANARDFEDAVASAVATQSESDTRSNESQNEIEMLKQTLSDAETKIVSFSANLVDMQAQNDKVENELALLRRTYDEALAEVSSAREALSLAHDERDSAITQLNIFTKTAKTSDQTMQTTNEKECQDYGGYIECCATYDTLVADKSLGSSRDLSIAPDSESAAPVPDQTSTEATSTYPDPVKMHAKYNRLKHNVLKMSCAISKLRDSGVCDAKLDSLISKRDELYSKAKHLKSSYDTIFGIVPPNNAPGQKSTQSVAGLLSTSETAVDSLYDPLGDPPHLPCTYMISFAKEMANNCPLRSALNVDYHSNLQDIGSAHFTSITTGGVLIEANVQTVSEHNMQQEMIASVVKDVTNLLKSIKQEIDTENVLV